MDALEAIVSLPSELRYWAALHPAVATFRWDHTAWGASWGFLMASVVSYLVLAPLLALLLFWRKKPIPLGPLPALYNLVLFVASLAMFVGCWQSAMVEIEETRWLWRRYKTPAEWFLCFPVGTRPAGRVFFWSYVFYVSKYYELLDTALLILSRRPVTIGHVARHAAVVVMCFLWLEFSQSLQIFALLTNAGIYIIMFVYSFASHLCLLPPWRNALRHCQIAQFVLLTVASLGTLRLHLFRKEGGCNGMGAWIFTTLLNICVFPLVIRHGRIPYAHSSHLPSKKA